MTADPQPPLPRCGVVAILGAPNAGKSTLTNTLMGAKVAIVSPKVQTTRARLMGILVVDDAQLLLVDTPGIFTPKRRLDRAMVQAAWGGTEDADVVVLVVDAKRGFTDDLLPILDGLARLKAPRHLVLNKVDICAKERLLKLADRMNQLTAWDAIWMVSAETGSGVDDLRAKLAALMPLGPWHFPADQLTTASQRLMAAEITREKLFLQLHQELPYAAAVETEQWEVRRNGAVAIHQVIYLERDGQKAIILGHKGAQIKAIGAAARLDMEAAFGHKVHLFLHIKVRADWGDDRDLYRAMNLDWVS